NTPAPSATYTLSLHDALPIYCGTCPRVTIRAMRNGTEVAVAGGLCEQPFVPFRIPPEDVEMVEVGSADTHSRRRIFHILGQKQRSEEHTSELQSRRDLVCRLL